MLGRAIIAVLGMGLLAVLPAHADTFVTIPTNNDIQTNLISTFPTGIFTASNSFGTQFQIPASSVDSCGQGGICNFYDGLSSNGSSITMNVAIPDVTNVYTLMNAYAPPVGATLGTVEFFGSAGATQIFDLVAGSDIRDFYQGSYANTLSNTTAGVTAENAFTCIDPSQCHGAAGTGDVTTGDTGTYVIDEQDFSLDGAFATQTLTRIVMTNTNGSATPILLGVTASSVPEPASLALFATGLAGLGLTLRRHRKLRGR